MAATGSAQSCGSSASPTGRRALLVVHALSAARAAGAGATGAGSSCGATLRSICGPVRHDVFECTNCAGTHVAELRRAGCSNAQIATWCDGAISPGLGPFFESRLISPGQAGQLNTWANPGGTWSGTWELCYDSFTMNKTTAEFHKGCDAFAPTVTVAHNSGGRGVCLQCKDGPGSCGDDGSCSSDSSHGCYHPPCTCRAPGGGVCSTDGNKCWPLGSPCGTNNPGNFTFGGYVRRCLALPLHSRALCAGSDPLLACRLTRRGPEVAGAHSQAPAAKRKARLPPSSSGCSRWRSGMVRPPRRVRTRVLRRVSSLQNVFGTPTAIARLCAKEILLARIARTLCRRTVRAVNARTSTTVIRQSTSGPGRIYGRRGATTERAPRTSPWATWGVAARPEAARRSCEEEPTAARAQPTHLRRVRSGAEAFPGATLTSRSGAAPSKKTNSMAT